MKIGVSTTPWFSVRRPRRAWPSVASSSNWSMRRLSVSAVVAPFEQHRVAVAEEAVARLDRVAVQSEYMRVAGEGAEEHMVRAFGQVGVRQQPVDEAVLEARRDEDVGLSCSGQQPAGQRGGFDRTQCRRAGGNDAPAARARR